MSSKSNRTKSNRIGSWKAWLWMAIPLMMLIIFSYYPPIKALFDSFFDDVIVKGSIEHKFVGFGNYKEIFNDKVFWICIKNVVIFTAVGMVCGNFMTIMLAELLFNLRYKKLSAFFRVLFIIPILVPGLVILLIWKYLVFSSNGIMYQLTQAFGMEGLSSAQWYWDNNPAIAKFAIIFTNFPWVAGTSFLIYLAGLQNIPKSVMEACKLDNCSTAKRIRRIDMPLIASQLKYFLIMGVIGGFQNFDLQLIVVGTETDATNVLGLYLYDRAFGQGYSLESGGTIISRFGYASAVGMIILVITMVLTIINQSINKDKTKIENRVKYMTFKEFQKEAKKYAKETI